MVLTWLLLYCISDSLLVLWVSGSDLDVVLVVSLDDSDVAVVVFQMNYCCCGWVDLIWLLFLLFH